MRPNPLKTLLVGLLVFFAIDALIFRSGLYARILSPESIAGTLYYRIHFEQLRQPSGKKEILLTGDSKMSEGFSVAQFEKSNPTSDVKLIQAAVPGSSLRVWYYLLRLLDPSHDRYTAVVIPLHSYQITPAEDALNDYIPDAQMLEPVLDWKSQWNLASTFSGLSPSLKAWKLSLAQSPGYADDIQDFLSHPVRRLHLVKAARADAAQKGYGYGYDGHPESMDGLSFNPETHKISYPVHLTDFEKHDVARMLTPLPTNEAERLTLENTAYTREWLFKIASLYRGSKTRLIFLEYPEGPIQMPAKEPLLTAPDIRTILPPSANVVYFDENTFAFLGKPSFYFDMHHFCQAGRREFTHALGEMLIQAADLP